MKKVQESNKLWEGAKEECSSGNRSKGSPRRSPRRSSPNSLVSPTDDDAIGAVDEKSIRLRYQARAGPATSAPGL